MRLIKSGLTESDIKNKLLDFLGKYHKDIKPEFIDIMYQFLNSAFYTDEVPFMLYEFLSSQGLTNKKIDIHNKMFDITKSYIGSLDDKKITEVGAGLIPILSNKIVKDSNSTVTAFDPYLIKNFYRNRRLKYRKELFSVDKVDKQDLYIGLMPCEGTTELIKGVMRDKSDMILAFCGCSHFDDEELYYSYSYYEELGYLWRGRIIDEVDKFATENKYQDFSIDNESMPYPVLKLKR